MTVMDTTQLMKELEIPNNYRRMHGKKPMRWVHIWKARNRRIISETQLEMIKKNLEIGVSAGKALRRGLRAQSSVGLFEASARLGESAARASCSWKEFVKTYEELGG